MKLNSAFGAFQIGATEQLLSNPKPWLKMDNVAVSHFQPNKEYSVSYHLQ
jgi:hypothetical protein